MIGVKLICEFFLRSMVRSSYKQSHLKHISGYFMPAGFAFDSGSNSETETGTETGLEIETRE